MNTKAHYEDHLSKYYSWIFGGAEENIGKNKIFFESHNITPAGSKVAIDLGAGSGFQSTALSHIGFNVTSVDFSRQLLNEIENKNCSIEITEGNILDLGIYSSKNKEKLFLHSEI